MPARSKDPPDIDLDVAAAARAEADGRKKSMQFKAKRFALPPEMSFAFADALDRSDFMTAISELLGEEQAAEFLALKPTVKDVAALVNQASALYSGKKKPAEGADEDPNSPPASVPSSESGSST